MTDKTKITALALAKLLGVSDRTVRDLAKRGIAVRDGHGSYARDKSITRYCAHLRELATGRGGESAISNSTAERARVLKAQADQLEMKNAQTRGETMSATQMVSDWSDILRHVRSGVLAMPGRVAGRLPHLTRHDIAEIDSELRVVLTELGNADI